MVADRLSAPQLFAAGPTGRLNHGLQGPHVKVHSGVDEPKSHKRQLRDAWAELLSPFEFQWFATLTFETNVHPEAALKRWRRFTNDINRKLYGRRWAKRPDGGIYWIVALERQRRGVVHFHALMGDPRNLNKIARRLYWMDHWNEMAGFARIEAIRKKDAVLRYVTKYVMKDGEVEFSTNLGNQKQPQLLGVTE